MPQSALRQEISLLRGQIASLRKRARATAAVAAMPAAKRFRIGSFQTGLIVLGGTVTGTVKWSTPMPTSTYFIDATCAAIGTSAWTYTITAQSAEGCTVQFTAPVLLAAGTIVTVLAVSPAST